MMSIETTMPRLTSILAEAACPRDPLLYKTGFWGRGQVNIDDIYYHLLYILYVME